MTDIARHIGVSRATVSYALSDDPQIPEQTRLAVLRAAGQLGYRPNAGARALASRKSNLFGLITDIVTTPFAGSLINGAQNCFWERDSVLLIVGTNHAETLEQRSLELLMEHRIQGLLFATTYNRALSVPPEFKRIPTVLIHCSDRDGVSPCVVPDEVQGGYLATKYLIQRGRTRIAFLNLHSHLAAAAGRKRGYTKALREARRQVDNQLIVEAGATAAEGYEAAGKLFELQPDVDAIFCATDRLAMGVYDAARERGKRIPQDIAVVGFDNQEIIADYLRPPLTTIALPFQDMGRVGSEILLQLAADERLNSPK